MSLVATAATVAVAGGVGAGETIASPEGRDVAAISRSLPRSLQVRSLSTSELADKTESLYAVTPMYATGTINLRAKASEKADLLGSVKIGTKVQATTVVKGKYRMVQSDEQVGWVLASMLEDDQTVSGGITMAPCPRGSAIEAKLRDDTIRIYRSVCALFPDINSIGGWRAGGRSFHKNGRALDLMLTRGKESALGWQITKYLIANHQAFNIDHIIFEQKIWTPRTPRWRKMANRGSATANHMDHVHVAIKA